jgi:hypothetical protein
MGRNRRRGRRAPQTLWGRRRTRADRTTGGSRERNERLFPRSRWQPSRAHLLRGTRPKMSAGRALILRSLLSSRPWGSPSAAGSRLRATGGRRCDERAASATGFESLRPYRSLLLHGAVLASGDDRLDLTQLGVEEAGKSPIWPMFADVARTRIALSNRSHTAEEMMRPLLSHLTSAKAARHRQPQLSAQGVLRTHQAAPLTGSRLSFVRRVAAAKWTSPRSPGSRMRTASTEPGT